MKIGELTNKIHGNEVDNIYILIYTHELKNLHISAMAYYINTLDGERSVHGRCEPKCFKDGDLF